MYSKRRFPLQALINRMLVGTMGMFLFVSAAHADPIVELQILNATGPNGEIIVVAGEDIEVSFNVTLDTAGVLDKNDTLSLIDLADNSVVSSKNRGKNTSGSIILTVPPNVTVGQYYVHYMTKDGITEIARVSHPDDVDSIPLLVLADSTTAELTAQVAELAAADLVETASRIEADAAETASRIAADEAEAAARAEADAAETASRIAADQAEATARAQADAVEAASRIAADQAEATTRAAADAAETASRIAADEAATAALQAESAARAAADSAEAAIRAAEDLRLQADITTNAMGIADNAAAIESLQAEISSINIQIDNIKTSISSAEALISGNTSAIADAQLLIDSNAGDIVSIQADLSAMMSQYSLDNASIMAAIGDINTELANLNTQRETLANDLNAQLLILSNSVTDNTAAISANMLEIIAINAQLTGINSSILSLNNTVTTLEAKQQENFDAISILNLRADEFQQEVEQIAELQAFKQNLVNGICPDGSAVKSVQEDGSFVCEDVAGSSGIRKFNVYRSAYLAAAYYTSTWVSCGFFSSCKHWYWVYPSVTVTATCPTGSFLTGGYGSIPSGTDSHQNRATESVNHPANSWIAAARNRETYGKYVYSTAICVSF